MKLLKRLILVPIIMSRELNLFSTDTNALDDEIDKEEKNPQMLVIFLQNLALLYWLQI